MVALQRRPLEPTFWTKFHRVREEILTVAHYVVLEDDLRLKTVDSFRRKKISTESKMFIQGTLLHFIFKISRLTILKNVLFSRLNNGDRT